MEMWDPDGTLHRDVRDGNIAEDVYHLPREQAPDYSDPGNAAALQADMESRRLPGNEIDSGWVYEWSGPEQQDGESRELLRIWRTWRQASGVPFTASARWRTGTTRSQDPPDQPGMSTLSRSDLIALASLGAVSHGPESEQ